MWCGQDRFEMDANYGGPLVSLSGRAGSALAGMRFDDVWILGIALMSSKPVAWASGQQFE